MPKSNDQLLVFITIEIGHTQPSMASLSSRFKITKMKRFIT